MKCRHCGADIRALKDADTNSLTWVHCDLENYLYLHCRAAVAEPPETVGEWRDRLFQPMKEKQ